MDYKIERWINVNIKEKDLYHAIENTGPFAKETFYYEVPIGSWATSRKKIDMVILKNQKLISIEVKISDWKKVLRQAYTNLYAFDYSYAAIWHETIPNVDTHLFKKFGIGILKVDASCEEIVKPKRSKLIISETYNYAKNNCKFRKESIGSNNYTV